ncbi:MAG: type II toxin-antitoxin system VapC family toxin [Desulfobacterales bacterium]|uniref:Type II toxin-antitoxin system VapC family toxin n=1 Tax=Candidatus Desulfatibia vada TaxID=2841696 RepID=A0A8J6NU00_9BACT|nr:type II toxin-antitoxin system VapC family toxin [Candidatus Desulfatibia vada]MBL7218165.1 type II toxin-antitoxin system VapC family toxin [Desulfobacteraceae bacterium]
MNIIIDTHIFLWALSDPSKISDVKRSALEDLSNTIYVSAVSIAELMIKASLEKLRIDFDPVLMANESGFVLLDFSAEAALLLKDMPFHHKDPFDRMLIAQSITDNYPIMTEDPKIALYNCQVL